MKPIIAAFLTVLLVSCTTTATDRWTAEDELSRAWFEGLASGGQVEALQAVAKTATREYHYSCASAAGGGNVALQRYCVRLSEYIVYSYFKLGNFDPALSSHVDAILRQYDRVSCFNDIAVIIKNYEIGQKSTQRLNLLGVAYIVYRKLGSSQAKQYFAGAYTCAIVYGSWFNNRELTHLKETRNFQAAVKHFYPNADANLALRYTQEVLVPLRGELVRVMQSTPPSAALAAKVGVLLTNAINYANKQGYPVELSQPLDEIRWAYITAML